MNIQKARSFGEPVYKVASIIGALFVVVCLTFIEIEVPVTAAEIDGEILHVYYWDKHSPRVRLALTIDENREILSVRVYKSFGLFWWFRPSRQDEIALPKGTEHFLVLIPNQDMARFE